MNESHHYNVLAPQPEVSYPVPWRVAESRNGHEVVVCAAGHYVAEAPTEVAAAIIVEAVNRYFDTLGEMGLG